MGTELLLLGLVTLVYAVRTVSGTSSPKGLLHLELQDLQVGRF